MQPSYRSYLALPVATGSLAGGEQSARQPPSKLQLAKRPPPASARPPSPPPSPPETDPDDDPEDELEEDDDDPEDEEPEDDEEPDDEPDAASCAGIASEAEPSPSAASPPASSDAPASPEYSTIPSN
jgi:hypothetical protein